MARLVFGAAAALAGLLATATPALAQTATTPIGRVSYPRTVADGRAVTFRWTLTDVSNVTNDEVIVFTRMRSSATYKITLPKKIPGGDCGVTEIGADDVVYCILPDPERWDDVTVSFRAWPSGDYATLVADHYWGSVTTDSEDPDDYIALIRKRLSRSVTSIN